MNKKEYLEYLKNKTIKYRDTLNLDSNITFGVEIEYENIVTLNMTYYLEHILKFKDWKNDIDVSILEHFDGEKMNGEVDSPILIDIKENWEKLSKVLKLIRDKRGIVTDFCGGHVNIGAHVLEGNTQYFINLLLLWCLYDEEIHSFASGEFKKIRLAEARMIDRISPRIKRNLFDIISGEIPKLNQGDELSFFKVLSKNYEEGNVIEFRLPNATLKEEIWQNNINFFAKLLIACKKELDTEKVVYDIENNNHDIFELADFVFTDDLDKGNFLIQALKLNKEYKKRFTKHNFYE